MIKLTIAFMKALLSVPGHWVAWLGLLIAANMVAPLFFLGTVEAGWVLAALFAGVVIQLTIFHRLGFVRLLGIGHLPWLVLVPWLWGRLDFASGMTVFDYWMLSVVVLDSLSLLIDITDVVRYLRGERQPANP